MAWTERYIRSDAAGGGNGTTDANSGANGAWTLAEGVTNEAAGMRLNVKAGTYASTTTGRTLAATGTTTAPVWWRGFKTTAGDQDSNNVAVAGTDIPEFTFTTGQLSVSGAFHVLSNISVTGACTTASGQTTMGGANQRAHGCRFANTASNSAARALTLGSGAGGTTFTRCYFTASATSVDRMVNVGANDVTLAGCVFDGSTVGALVSTRAAFLYCVFLNQAGNSLQIASYSVVANCSFYGGGGHGINVAAFGDHSIINCHFENYNQASKFAIANTSGADSARVLRVGNSYYNCTGYEDGFGDSPAVYDNGARAASGYTNAAGGDFSASTELKAVGFPGLLENVSAYRGYLDLGAVQRQEPAGGGGLLRHPGMSGGAIG